LVILLVIRFELSFDKFHSDSEKIFRINNELRLSSGNYKYPTSTSALAAALSNQLPEVTDYTRMSGGGQQLVIEVDTELYKENNSFFVDTNFLEFFNFSLLQGQKEQVLSAPNTVVLTETAAVRYFGNTNVIGKTLKVKGQQDTNYEVTGLLENLPKNTHIAFDLLFSNQTFRSQNANFLNSWANDGFYNYIKLTDAKHANLVTAKMVELKAANIEEGRLHMFNPDLIALEDIHLKSNLRNEISVNGSMDFVYIFTAVGVFVLLIAGINYMNLATARSAKRAKEVGMRKVLGAYRKQLINQFLGESLVLASISALLSLIMVYLLIGSFSSFINKPLSSAMLFEPEVLGALALIVVVIGLGSGVYPALFLSAFKPVVVLKGKLAAGMGGSGIFRQALVVFQFVISIVMIIGTVIVYNQLSFLQNKPLGFERENILMVSNTNQAITPRMEAFKNELEKNPSIEGVTATFSKPGGLRPIIFVKSESVSEEVDGLNLAGINIYLNYLDVMNIEVQDGRNFDPTIPTDSTEAIIINRRAEAELNLKGEAVGKFIDVQGFGGDWQRKQIIGVIDDINFEPLQRRTESCFYAYFFPNFQEIFIKVNPESQSEVVSYVRDKWTEFAPSQPFEYSFLEEDLAAHYDNEKALSQLVVFFAILAVGIACLGLFGLASYSTEQRIKEVGVRKVLGASIWQVLYLLSKDFAILIAIAFVIAAPVAFYLSGWWLQNFAFSITPSVLTFLLAGFVALFIALLTVSQKTYAAAKSNPVKALRSE
jgi:putative ABC transport system permease protein